MWNVHVDEVKGFSPQDISGGNPRTPPHAECVPLYTSWFIMSYALQYISATVKETSLHLGEMSVGPNAQYVVYILSKYDQYASTWRGNQEHAELVLPVGSCQDMG